MNILNWGGGGMIFGFRQIFKLLRYIKVTRKLVVIIQFRNYCQGLPLRSIFSAVKNLAMPLGGTIILKSILKLVMWSECIWIRVGIGGGLLCIMECGIFDSVSPEDQVKYVQCTVDVRDTSIQIAATGLPSVGLCGVLAPRNLHFFYPLKKHLGIYRCRSVTESA
jgi:hypothetical protein